ncbi:hypothetical protein CCUS01_12041 [Colletotrichum cuscutae]|uniref:Uncharacterized protein n=1 Tax=Colletotrichum cuscutae TaxID=1209917 RepID=A0AAI9TXU4_9PEZI|nr:hypothetical protein CCUS01_12041 [Colletotrichum cuscutae]
MRLSPLGRFCSVLPLVRVQWQSTEVPSRPSIRPNTGPWLRPEMVNPWSSSCGLEPSLQSTCWLGNRQGVMAVLQHYLMPDYTCYTVIALPVTRGCNARLMSWGKGYLEPYHAATRYDLDPSHASPAFVQKANTGKMNKEGI